VPGYALSTSLVGWSLSVETFFYALFPALILMSRRVRLPSWCTIVAIVWLAGQLWAAFVAKHFGGPLGSPGHQFVNYFPVPFLGCFLVGITAGLLVRRQSFELRPRPALLLLFGSLSLTAAVLILDWPGSIPKHQGLLAPAFAATIVALYFLPSGWRSSAPAKLLGEASYALYILHWPLAPFFQKLIAPALGFSAFTGFCFTVAALVAISVAVFLRLETPARAALRQRSALSRAGAAKSPC